jgi:hypothetical protein
VPGPAARYYDTIVKTTAGQLGGDRDPGRVPARPAALAGLAIVDLTGARDRGVFGILAELARELEPPGRPAPALLRGQR